MIPGLLIAPDFTKVACELFGDEVFDISHDSDAVKNERLEKARASARVQLELQMPAYAEQVFQLVSDFLESAEVITSTAIVRDNIAKQVVAFRLLAATLIWIRGGEDADLHREFRAFEPSVNKRWLPKHTDRLEQLIRMTFRFFSRGAGDLTVKMKLELPQLAVRVKHGIPFRASPYINVVGTEGVLPRSTVNTLYKDIPDPFSLLNVSNEVRVTRKIRQCLLSIAGNLRNESDVMGVVRTAYRDYLGQFLSELFSNDVQALLENVKAALGPENGEQPAFSDRWRCSRVLECLQDDFPVTEDEGEQDPPPDFRCLHMCEGPRESAIHLLNWHEEYPTSHWSITPCGFVLLLVLVRRRLVKWGQVSVKLQEMTPTRIDVYWIASHLWECSEGLKAMTSLRESMLALLEPVSVPA